MDNKEIRNFVIISHIDHGKSTLADRFLELTGAISKDKMKPQFLDMMDLEREKGITIKMQPVRMLVKDASGREIILNLIDTPGHVDFSYEVSRSLAAVEGAVLLVDATKGIQAQTLANLELAENQNLTIIPVVNKIDLSQAQIEKTEKELAQLLNIEAGKIVKISAKSGLNVEKILNLIITDIDAPDKDNIYKPFRALIFDSDYDPYKGIIAYVRVVDGEIKLGDKIRLMAQEAEGDSKELGYFTPQMSSEDRLSAGEIGYIATGIKEPDKIRVGDTIILLKDKDNPEVIALSGYKEIRPMVFASFYPESADDFNLLRDSLKKLKLNDPSLTFEPETKEALGRGFRCGFLGTLHTEIISERLKREFGLNLVISSPSVVYRVIDNKGQEKFIYSASSWPESSFIKESEEPWVYLEVISPVSYIGSLNEVLKNLRGSYIDTKYLGEEKVILSYEVPLREIITNLYDKIKSATQGYASMSYKVIDYRPSNLVKLEVLIAGEKEEAFSKIVSEEQSYKEARALVLKIKEFLPSQQFSVSIQALVGGKIIARETLKAQRKDVTGYLYGGDYTRKRKLLEKQKKGKKKLKEIGKIKVPPKVFLEVFRG
ncbi:MAG: translation elongation factor 4 [Candidatus Pacebacteria bacterium]|nr:translation elongation factor 4 [Candidatus Paceibacterota bacterium]